MKRQSMALAVLVSLSIVGPGLPNVEAKDSVQRSTAEAKSRREGMGQSGTPLLNRVKGPGSEAVLSSVLKRFANSASPITTLGSRKKDSKGGRVSVKSKDWSLYVALDGTAVRYVNHVRLDAAPKSARRISERLSHDKLEELGREFIATQLKDFIRVGSGEDIIPLYSQYQIAGGGSTKSGAPPEQELVVTGAIVFSRTVDGIPIVGAGSKVAITFSNDGTPVAFDFDWPTYQKRAQHQKVLDIGKIKERGKSVLAFDVDSADVKLSRFECGLLDLGIQRRDANAPVQAACFVQAVQRKIVDAAEHAKDPDSGHLLVAIAEAIPAGVVVEPDKKWPQAMKVLGESPAIKVGPPNGPKQRR